MGPNGSNIKRILKEENIENFSISPDGSKILYVVG
jgi:hypothetical protein